MSDPPPSRRKSCRECVTAKRKCTQELPRCKRCAKKNIVCSYPNNRAQSVSQMAIPELEFPWLDDLMQNPGMLPWSGGLQPQLQKFDAPNLAPSLDDSAIEIINSSHHTSPQSHLSSGFVEGLEPDYLAAAVGPVRSSLARAETEAAVHRFKTWPEKWVKEGKAPFIHPMLYQSGMPKPLQDAYAACAIYSTKTPQNEFVALTVIESKANELVRSPNQASWTPLDLLAAIQALLIFQFIRLFDGDIRQRAQAEQSEQLLESWTEQLKSRTEEEQRFTTMTAPSWRSWVFAESVRRTVSMSYFLSGIYSLVKQGYCTLSEKVTANSFTAQKELWDCNSALDWERAKQMYKPYWVNRMKFDDLLREGKGTELDDFGMVMMITYKGQDTVDHWLSTSMERNLVMDQNFHQSLLGMVSYTDVGSVSSSSDRFDSNHPQSHHSGSAGITPISVEAFTG
ncbi:hypothetical protein BDV96DRAFT_645639 [Lophiotrema nucula]|uniref:Zn(2)-C6 fungal-type domain-containing protein n=1 Tax=Lophiotrema nucula TaxID=690887 RepID=A0A6A5ZD47_9PLEO|nr:hypothetical protein BDV96DRAFT_645639 [Lophiotrema nucula]